MEQTDRINKPKLKILQLFCRHRRGQWFKKNDIFYNLSGETQYEVCPKCGKLLNTRFMPNPDE